MHEQAVQLLIELQILRRGSRKFRACTRKCCYGTGAAACAGGQCAWAELHRTAGVLEDTRPAAGLQALGERAGCHGCGGSQAVLQGARSGVRALLQACCITLAAPRSVSQQPLRALTACSKSSEVKTSAERHPLEQPLHAGGCSLLT